MCFCFIFSLTYSYFVPLQESVGPDNVAGYRQLCKLSSYLFSLRDQLEPLSHQQVASIIKLWDELGDYDKMPTVFKPRHKTNLAQGRFKAPKTPQIRCGEH